MGRRENMKHVNECKKCESADILKIEGKQMIGETINQLRTTILESIPVTRFLCSDCGYTEEWVENHLDLKRMKRKVSQVNESTHSIKKLLKNLEFEV